MISLFESVADSVDGIQYREPVAQGSKSWLEWRKQGVGGSDVPIIMGVSPWSTPYQLWLEKTGQKAGFEGNFATQRGQELEPIARAQYELEADCDMEPALIVHPEYSFMRVSLDGYNAALRRVLEIKCPGKDDHTLAKAGKVPAKYMPQLQYQLYVSQAELAHYYSFDGTSGVIVEVKPDFKMQEKIAAQVNHFWLVHVLDGVPPALSDKDDLKVEDSEGLFKAFANLQREHDALSEKLEAAKNSLIQRYGNLHVRVSSSNVELVQQTRKGSVDYAKVPALDAVDLEQYRKPSVKFFTVRLKSNNNNN